MNGPLRWLTLTPVILVSLVLMLLIGLSFAPVQNAVDGRLLDMIWSGEAAEARLAGMSAVQRTAHFWGTVINDTAYPLAYGALLAGLSGRFAGERWKAWAMLPAGLTVIADLVENTVQALALTGTADLLAAKSVLTPLKFGLFMTSVILALGLGLMALVRWIMRRGEAA